MNTPNPWNLKESDFPKEGSIEEQVTFLCHYGILAPSVHNIQPWEFLLNNNGLSISPTKKRTLDFGDPTGRQVALSIGACLENISIAANHFGLEATFHTTNRNNDFSIKGDFRKKSSRKSSELLKAIFSRRTNRHPFIDKQLDRVSLKKIADGDYYPGTKIVLTENRETIQKIGEFTAKATAMAFSLPPFRKELSKLILPRYKKGQIGIPTHTLHVDVFRQVFAEPHLVRLGLNAKSQAKKEKEIINSSAALCFVFSKGDVLDDWIIAGRAYQKVGLLAAAEGISQSTTAATVEAADFHTDIERVFKTKYRLQAVIRLGYSTKEPRHSPRLPLGQVLQRV